MEIERIFAQINSHLGHVPFVVVRPGEAFKFHHPHNQGDNGERSIEPGEAAPVKFVWCDTTGNPAREFAILVVQSQAARLSWEEFAATIEASWEFEVGWIFTSYEQRSAAERTAREEASKQQNSWGRTPVKAY